MTRYPNNDSSTTKNLGDTSDYDRSSRKPPDPFESLDLSFIGKSILYICLTVVTIVFVNSCQVDEEVIKQCETSCSSNGNRMDSVSVFGCDCEQKQDSLTRSEFWNWIANANLGDRTKVEDFYHHESHAYSACIMSGFGKSVVLTCDGRGDYESLSLSVFDPSTFRLKKLFSSGSADSLGFFYGRITGLMGFKPCRHEGKITGLAAFGNYNNTLQLMKKMIDFDGNKIVSGDWWEVGTEQSLVSLEDGFAEDIGARVGDMLTLRIAADEFSVEVASIREVNWESMQPNFFVIFPDKLLERFPNTLFTSFYLEPDEKYRVGELLDVMPTLTIIELDVAIQEIKTIIDQVSQAIELVLLIILVAGAMVLIAGVSSSVDERLHESAILRALGAGRGTLLGAVAIEFATMGSLAGILAILGSETAGWVLQTQMLDLEYQIQWVLWPMGIALGAVIIGSLGTYACRRVVWVPPLQVLREL